jgi:hypothetical protein
VLWYAHVFFWSCDDGGCLDRIAAFQLRLIYGIDASIFAQDRFKAGTSVDLSITKQAVINAKLAACAWITAAAGELMNAAKPVHQTIITDNNNSQSN